VNLQSDKAGGIQIVVEVGHFLSVAPSLDRTAMALIQQLFHFPKLYRRGRRGDFHIFSLAIKSNMKSSALYFVRGMLSFFAKK